MTDETRSKVDEMLVEVSQLEAGCMEDLDKIWDRNYDSIVTAIDVTSEEENHEKIAEIRNNFYEGAEKFSFECDYCGDTFYGQPYKFQREDHCINCYYEHQDDFHDA